MMVWRLATLLSLKWYHIGWVLHHRLHMKFTGRHDQLYSTPGAFQGRVLEISRMLHGGVLELECSLAMGAVNDYSHRGKGRD